MVTRSCAARSLARIPRVGWVLVLRVLLAACSGRGGGSLPPDSTTGFSGQATLGFSFSCESPSLNGPTGRLRIELQYSDKGSTPLGGPFAVHGEADSLDPVLESMICIGQNPPPGGYELIFLGVYRVTSSPPPGFPTDCAITGSDADRPPCRFEVIVRDNDGDRGPSKGDFFSIKLSQSTVASSELASFFYFRAGVLGGGNLQVD